MNIELSDKEFRRLLDMVYIGNWILNSIRGDDRIKDYDDLESKIFAHCIKNGMFSLIELVNGEILPSGEFSEGGIHEAIMDYEDTVFYEILAEELARRVREICEPKELIIVPHEPFTGAHVGPGMLALFFFGAGR